MVRVSKSKLSHLSPLEFGILKILWQKNMSTVRSIHTILKTRRKVALTSIAVLLDRLHKRGFVKREIESGKGGFHYIYYPTHSEDSFKISVIEKTVDQLIKSFGSTAITYFNEKFSKKRVKHG